LNTGPPREVSAGKPKLIDASSTSIAIGAHHRREIGDAYVVGLGRSTAPWRTGTRHSSAASSRNNHVPCSFLLAGLANSANAFFRFRPDFGPFAFVIAMTGE
jgi:hypothetical protein